VYQFGRHRDKLRVLAKAGVLTEIAAGGLPRAEYGWMTQPCGTVIMKSTVHWHSAGRHRAVVVDEITLVGSALRALRARSRTAEARGHQCNADDRGHDAARRVPKAFERAAEKGTLKVLLVTS
jgi:alcohol dehydrogenase